MKKQQLKILVINLKKREDKLSKFKQMNPYLDFKIIEAIDGTELNNNYKQVAKDLSLTEEVCKPEWFFNKKNFKCMTCIPKYLYGRIGCLLSHYKALLHAEANSIYPLVILEDDVKLIRTNIPDPPEDCFMFYLGGSIQSTAKYKIGWDKIKSTKGEKVWGGFAYGFPTLQSIKQTLGIIKSGFFCETSFNIYKHEWNSFYKRTLQPIDNFYINNIHIHNKAYIYIPLPATHIYDGKSDISAATHKKYDKSLKYLPPVRYVNVKNPDVFKAYVSIIYYFLENEVPKLYFEDTFKRKYDPLKHKFAFQSVGNRISLSADGKTRLSCIHLGIKKTFKGNYKSCIGNNRYPELFKVLKDMHASCFPQVEFNQILINKNNVFKPHVDSNNIKNDSLLFTIGDYKGDINIEGNEINTNMNPILFNGKKLTHSVPGPIRGTRYSLLFYSI